MNLLKNFVDYVKQQNLFQPKDKLLLAVSGGVDSVVLCELCKQAGYDFMITHCNFQLRADESERDENFVRELGNKYNVEVLVKKFDTENYAAENKLSIQVAARELRYNWFDELLKNRQLATGNWQQATGNKQRATGNWQQATGNKQLAKNNESSVINCPLPIAHFLLTAHHANDHIETLLMNFFKGTGITGLHGILPKQGQLIRPLLFAKKAMLLEFAETNKLSFAEDSSNSSDKYTRNYFRNHLIPDLQKVFPQVEDNLLHNLERFGEIEMLYQQAVSLAKKNLLEKKGNEIHIPVLKLLKTSPLKTIIHEIIKDYGFTAHQSEEVMGLLKSESGKYILSASHRILKNRNWLIIAPNETVQAETIFIEDEEKNVQYAMGNLQIKRLPVADCQLPIANSIAILDAGKITFPLLLRKWKPGDYFYPLGMQKKKKLSRFFIDQKLSLIQKEKTWVVEMDKKIIWVVGLRIDDRFKITTATKEILRITLIPAE